MKTTFKFSLYLLALAIMLTSCDKEKVIIPINEETVTLGFNIKADLDIIEMPLEKTTRADRTAKTYAVQVYEYSSNTNSLLPYAYGIFDDVSKMSITMTKSKTYKIYIGLFLDFFDKYKFGYNEASTYYTSSNNEFIYSQEWIFRHWWTNLSTGFDNFYLNSDSKEASQSMIECDSYCGIIDKFNAADNNVIEAQLTRSAFGVQINVSGMTEGKLVWEGRAITPGNLCNTSHVVCSIEYPETKYEQLFTIAQFLRSMTSEDNYIEFDLYYYNSSNTKQILNEKSLTIHRNKKTVVNITLQSASSSEVNRPFSISTSQDTMGEEELAYSFEIN